MVLRRLWNGWLVVARKIGHVQSQVILTLVYFVVIAPFALAVRLFTDPLGLRSAPAWHDPARPGGGAATVDSVRQQF